MSLRLLHLPDDLLTMAGMAEEIWQYPGHPEWGIQQDEAESASESARNLRRIWPLVRVFQGLSPRLRDIVRGYVWEENGQVVGFTNANRQGGTHTWYIASVGVLPAYRGQGIAQKLVEATVALIRKRGGARVLLDMTDGNVPAYKLYEKVGFARYSSSGMYTITPDEPPPASLLPEGYRQEPQGYADWQPRYELEKRVIPGSLQEYEPVERSRYHRSLMARLLKPIVAAADGAQRTDFVIRTDEGLTAAWAWYEIRTEENAVSQWEILLDPAHGNLAPYLVTELLNKTITASPGHRVEIVLPAWMEAVTRAVEEAGLERRLGMLRMGLLL